MKVLNILIVLSLVLSAIGCKKQDGKVDDKIEKKMADTLKYSAEAKGNKLKGIITIQKKAGPDIFRADQVDSYLAGQFLYNADKGTLMKLKKTTGKKMYLDTYDIPVTTFEALYNNKHDDSVGLQLRFVEIDKDYGLINLDSSYSNFLYIIAVPVDTDGKPVGKDNKYVVFNLSKDFDINTSKIEDEEYQKLIKKFTAGRSEIYDSLKSYYSRNNKGNTTSVFYSWGDIRDNINKFCNNNKYDKIKFKLGEIIGINSIRYYIDQNPDLMLDTDKYNFAYNGREKQLTIIGEFYLTKITAGVRQSMSADKYFDMGSLYP